MDVETEPAKETERSGKQTKPANVIPEKSKETKNNKNSKPKRSRSRTPQKKSEDDSKTLHISLKQVTKELNGNEIVEEKDEERNGHSEKVDNAENGVKEEPLKISKPVQEVENGEPSKIESVRQSTASEGEDLEKCNTSNNGFKENESIQSPNELVASQNESETSVKQPTTQENVEMDPLVISDEVDPELQFLEDNSDRESPILNRCTTRRSYTRNIPTPKTPKLAEQEIDSEKNSVADQTEEICNLPNDIPITKTDSLINSNGNDSLDTPNVSTKVEVGSDATRLNFSDVNSSEGNNSTDQDQSYLNNLRERGLSSRRPIRGAEDYRRRVLKTSQNRSDLNSPYDQTSKGVKRKDRSLTPEESKKFCPDSSNYTFFTSPWASIKNKFRSELSSSTPELLGYKDDKRNLHFNDNMAIAKIEDAGEEQKKSWCTVM